MPFVRPGHGHRQRKGEARREKWVVWGWQQHWNWSQTVTLHPRTPEGQDWQGKLPGEAPVPDGGHTARSPGESVSLWAGVGWGEQWREDRQSVRELERDMERERDRESERAGKEERKEGGRGRRKRERGGNQGLCSLC